MKRECRQLVLLLGLLALVVNPVHAQLTKVRGTITDVDTKEPLPFVNVSFTGTTIGTITNFKGEYFLETRSEVDSIVASFVGYEPITFKVKPSVFQTLDFNLSPSDYQLDEVVVVPGENPAHVLLRKIVENKDRNDPAKVENYEYEAYNKMELDVNNLTEDFKNKKVFKHFDFIFNYIDTSVITGKSYLPVFISEALSDYYYQSKPKRVKEVIKASNISGVDNESISQYTGQMYIDINVYDNYVPVFGKQFVSPIANFGKLYYKYYLVDSMYRDNQWCYQISFKPRRKQEPTFTGEFWVHDTTFGLKEIKVRIADDANINYVNDLVASFQYKYIDDSIWFLEKDNLFVDFNIEDEAMGFFGRKTTSKKNIKLKVTKPAGFFTNNAPQESITLSGAMEKDTSFWNESRHEKLTTKEESIYAMVDSIQEVPVFKTFADIVTLVVAGYYEVGYVELGPYYKTYSSNPVEGHRFRLGGRTSRKFSNKLIYEGHLAYGTDDERFKYGMSARYILKRNPRVEGKISYKHDMEQLGQSPNAFTEDNIMSTALARNPKDKLLMVNEFSGYYMKEWFLGFSNKVSFNHRTFFPEGKIKFESTEDQFKRLTALEFTLNTRLAWNEKFIEGRYERVSLGSEWPVVDFDATVGVKDMLDSDYEYLKLHLSVYDHFNLNPFGEFRCWLNAGQIYGNLPYPLLKLHEGNETYAFDEYSFNMMNYYEFASDRWASLHAEQHFEGFFLNRIPLLRKLKWREVMYGKMLVGDMSEKNRQEMFDFPTTLHSLNKPYFEGGVGIENIFKIIRIDAVWRLSHLDRSVYKNIQVFGLRAKLQIVF